MDQDYIATCRTDGCINEDIPIEVTKRPAGDVFCGPCRNEITDIVDA